MNGRKGKSGQIAIFLVLILAGLVLLFALIMLRIIMPYNLPVHYAGIIFLFLGINPGIFFWLFIGKKFPPKGYWKFLFILTILIELIAAVMFHPQVYYY